MYDPQRGRAGRISTCAIAAVEILSESAGYHGETGRRLAAWFREETQLADNVLLRPLGNVVYVTPSLNIPDDDLERLLGIVRESVEAVSA